MTEDVLHEGAILEVTVYAPLLGPATAYADTAEGAMLALRTLRKDAGLMGAEARIVTLITGQVWSGVR